MGNIGWPELLVIVVIILILFGPNRLPEVGRSIGKAIGEFRKAFRDGMEDKPSKKKD